MKERNNSLDLYRVLCMFLITTIHIIGYGNLMPSNSVNAFLVDLIEVLQYFSISGFTLISGFFLVNKTSTKDKIISFIPLIFFYSVTIFLISLTFNRNFTVPVLAKVFLPTAFVHYWYPVNYLFLLLLVPFLNQFIHSLSRIRLLSFISVLTFITSVFYHFSPFVDPTTYIGHYSHSILWFVLLYFISAYIRIYGVKHKKLFGPVMFFVCGALIFALRIKAEHRIFDYINVLMYNSILSLLFTVSSFIMFTNFKIRFGKRMSSVLSYCMPAVFVVYLIQEHIAVRDTLWKFVNINKWAGSVWLIPIMISVFLALLIIAVILNAVYQLAHKLFIGKLENVALKICDHIEDTIKSKYFEYSN